MTVLTFSLVLSLFDKADLRNDCIFHFKPAFEVAEW